MAWSKRFDSVEERFMDKVAMIPIAGCWLWVGAGVPSDKFDYGSFMYKGAPIRAHKAAWLIFRGPIKKGLCVCHACDVPGCVNPHHLWLGTKADNSRDMVMKGRGRNHLSVPRGEAHHASTLTAEAVRRIRELYASGAHSQSQLGEMFGVTQTAILKVVRRLAWKHV